MKFTEDEAYNELVAELKKKEANPLINERGIRDLIKDDESLLGDSEMELSEYVAKRINIIKSLDGNIRKVATTQIDEYKKLKEEEDKKSKSNSTDPQNAEPAAAGDGVLKALQESLAEIKNELEQSKRQATIANKTSTLKSEMKKAGVTDDKWIDAILSKVNIDKDFNAEEEAKSYLELYNLQRASFDDYTQPGTSGSKSEDEFFEAERKRREKKLEEERRL